jgi:hypothetical protein
LCGLRLSSGAEAPLLARFFARAEALAP